MRAAGLEPVRVVEVVDLPAEGPPGEPRATAEDRRIVADET
jgi:hypothetical protein